MSYPISREHSFLLTDTEMLNIAIAFYEDHPDVLDVAIDVIKMGDKINCPFPFECNRFPCEGLYCNADTLSNGYAYRMS